MLGAYNVCFALSGIRKLVREIVSPEVLWRGQQSDDLDGWGNWSDLWEALFT